MQRATKLAQQTALYRQQQKISHLQQYIDRFKAKATKAKQAQSHESLGAYGIDRASAAWIILFYVSISRTAILAKPVVEFG